MVASVPIALGMEPGQLPRPAIVANREDPEPDWLSPRREGAGDWTGAGQALDPCCATGHAGGEVLGIDIQPKMVERLRRNAEKAGVTNVTVILADAAQPHVPEATFDLVFLCTALGEIPDRSAALTQCYRALKPGGRLYVTEVILDPHYQRRSTVQALAERAEFRLVSIEGGWWFYTANFVKA